MLTLEMMKMKNRIARRLTLMLLAVGLASSALASDGVLEINQTCAVNTGCFSGDTAGFPVSINGTAGRSYRLTSDLTVPDENTDGIVVSADNVGIDLNNFAIVGPVTCSESPLTCSHFSGTGSGVVRNSVHVGTSVKNGSISGMGNFGIYLGSQAEVTNLRVRWNRYYGIFANTGSTVSGNTAYQNGSKGISTGHGSTVSGNTAYQNGNDGISVLPGSTVSGNTASRNGRVGIYTASGSTVSNNTVYDNASHGIRVYNGSTVSGNTVRYNEGWGISFEGVNSAYSGNVISTNAAGTVNGTAIEIGQNACDGNTTCP